MSLQIRVLFQILSVLVVGVYSDPILYDATIVATNISSTIGTPAISNDQTTVTSQNTTDAQYEVSSN